MLYTLSEFSIGIREGTLVLVSLPKCDPWPFVFIVMDSALFNDTFPSCLGNLSTLKLLLLQSNKFYGKILESPEINYGFPNLRILDLSYNNFTGKLPINSFKNWNTLKLDKEHNLTYIQIEKSFSVGSFNSFYFYYYSMKITNRDLDTAYHKVQQSFKEIDMSSNRFVERPRIIKPFSKETFVGDSITVSTTYFLPQMVQCFL